MDLVREAFNAVFPEKPYAYSAEVRYSGKFRGYNANIRLNKLQKRITLNLSSQWKCVSRDIQLGLVQHLLCRLFREKRRSTQIDLYNYFIKSVPRTIAKTKSHPLLAESFSRVNERFFSGMIDQPNLVVGNGITKLGSYDLGTDTVSISSILLGHPHLLDYVMYHELLHKKHQFQGSGLKRTFHSSAFREAEKSFPNSAALEKELSKLVMHHKRRSFWDWF
ncbi:MAG: hypothetical protein QXT19_02755 [Candidatus Woesearchaeota archaeon]